MSCVGRSRACVASSDSSCCSSPGSSPRAISSAPRICRLLASRVRSVATSARSSSPLASTASAFLVAASSEASIASPCAFDRRERRPVTARRSGRARIDGLEHGATGGRQLALADDLDQLGERAGGDRLRPHAGDQPAEQQTQLVDVRSGGDRLAAQLLRARAGGSERGLRGERRLVDRPGRLEQLGDSEIEPLDPPVGGDRQILGLEVAVAVTVVVGPSGGRIRIGSAPSAGS